MSTDNLLLLTQMQQMWPGMAAGAASAPLTDAGGSPAEFLQTLLQRMQAAAVPATEAIASAQAGQASSAQVAVPAPGSVSVETLVERLKTLIDQWGKAPAASGDGPALAETGQGQGAGGKTLPVETHAVGDKAGLAAGQTDASDTPAGLPLAAGAEQWLQDLIQRVMPQPQVAEIAPEAKAGAEAAAEPVMAPAAANRAVAELVQMLRAVGLPVDEALAAPPDTADAPAATGQSAPIASDVGRPSAPNSASVAQGTAGVAARLDDKGAPVSAERSGAPSAKAVPDLLPARTSIAAEPKPAGKTRVREDDGVIAASPVPSEGGRLTAATTEGAPAARPEAAPVSVPATAAAGSNSEPVTVTVLQSGSQPAAESDRRGAPEPTVKSDPVAVSDPVIAQWLRSMPEAAAENDPPAGSEPPPESVVRTGYVPLAAVAPRAAATPRQPKPVSGDAKSLSGLERLANRTAADADPLVAQMAQAPAAAREEAVVSATEQTLTPEAATVRAGLAGEPVVAAGAKPVVIAQDKVQGEIQAPVQHPKWAQELGERVNWVARLKSGIQTAEIKLNPAHLGPLEVRVNLNQDQASIQFVSHHAAVREAIESAVPKLREMLGEQNLNLVDVNVSQQSFSGDQRQPATAQFDFGRNSQGGGAAASASGFTQGDGEVTGETVQRQNRTDGGSLSLYA